MQADQSRQFRQAALPAPPVICPTDAHHSPAPRRGGVAFDGNPIGPPWALQSQPRWQDRKLGTKEAGTGIGLVGASCTMIWDVSAWNSGPYNPSAIR